MANKRYGPKRPRYRKSPASPGGQARSQNMGNLEAGMSVEEGTSRSVMGYEKSRNMRKTKVRGRGFQNSDVKDPTSYVTATLQNAKGRLMDNFAWTRTPRLNTAWDSDTYYVRRDAYLDPVTNMADHRAEWSSSFWAMSDHSLVKDWDGTQKQQWEEQVFYGLQYLINIGYAQIERLFNKLLTANDNSDYWTVETYTSHIASVGLRRIFVPLLSVNLAKALCKYTLVCPPWPAKQIPPTIYAPFRADMTITEARTMLDALATRTPGARIHAAKAQLPMVELTPAVISSIPGQYAYNSDEGIFWKDNTPFKVDDGGIEMVIDTLTADGDTDPTEFYTNTGTSYTNKDLCWHGNSPDDIHCLSRIVHLYVNGVNDIGMLTLDAAINDACSISRAAVDDNAFVQLGFPTNFRYAQLFSNSGKGITCEYLTTGIGAGNVIKCARTTADVIFRDMSSFVKNGISYADWCDFEDRWVACYGKEVYQSGRGTAVAND